MSKKTEYFCDFCGKVLKGYGYYHDATEIYIKIRTLSQSDADKNSKNDTHNFHLCDDDLHKFNKFIKESLAS